MRMSSSCNLLRMLMLMCLSWFALSSAAQEPVLEIRDGQQVRQWTRSALLSEAIDIVVEKDSAYKKSMNYRAVAFAKLMPNVTKYSSVQFIALDGFVATISGQDLAGAGQAYLAIEPTEGAWPAVNPENSHKMASAGPFYLVWHNPKAGRISNEQWPYQVAKISVTVPLHVQYPQLVPVSTMLETSKPSLRGMQVFIKNCAVCHRMNGGGDATIGPDLNLPFNPTEYFQEGFLRKLIRDPASVRSWKQSSMPSFDLQTISQQELDDLIQYLKQMAKQRKVK